MARRVVLYCPSLPPAPGGLPDQTLALARALAARGADLLVVGRHGDPALFAPVPCRTDVTVEALPAAAAGAAALVVQYVPFLYARLGLAPALPRALGRLRRAGVRLGVLLHEPYVPFTRLPWLATGWPMRWQFRAVMRRADAIWSPVPAFLAWARRVARPGAALAVAPVGSTVEVGSVGRDAARARLGLRADQVAIGVFSPGASGARRDWVAAAAASLADMPHAQWLFFGAGSERSPGGGAGGTPVRSLGRIEPQELSAVFRALDLAVAPFLDGLTLRRTSAMAALAHGVPLVSSTGHLFDPALAAAAACEETAQAFTATVRALITDPDRRHTLGEAGRRFYEERGSTAVLAARMALDLELT